MLLNLGNEAIALAVTVLILALAAWIYWQRSAPPAKSAGTVTSIVVYPLKSAKGVPVRSAALDERGLAFDRLWMVVDERGAFMSQRRAPRLALIEAALPASHNDPLRLRAPGAPPIEVPVLRRGSPASATAQAKSVRVWDDRLDGADQGDEAAAWLATVLGVDGVRLVRMEEGTKRQVSPKYAPRGSTTAFSDGFPLLLASEASLADVNARIACRGNQTIPMNRFRPNLVIGGGKGELAPFEEDSWSTVCVGSSAQFGVVKPCARCKMPTINQDTAVPDRRVSSEPARGEDFDDDEGGGPADEAEPTATLKTFRTGELLGYKKSGWAKDVFFGQNLVIRSRPGATISVGDAVVATKRRPYSFVAGGVPGVDF